MIGNPELNDKTFNVENYEEFYEHHTFVETDEKTQETSHELFRDSDGLLMLLKNLSRKIYWTLVLWTVHFQLLLQHILASPVTALISRKTASHSPKTEPSARTQKRPLLARYCRRTAPRL
jgi:hypothetical protein